jgi:glycerol-3-phosphate cytidylyltransferase
VCEVVYLPRTRDVSTTELRQYINALHAERIGELRAAVEHLARVVKTL